MHAETKTTMKDLEKALQNIDIKPDNEWYSSTLERIINESSKKQNNLFINLLLMTKVRLAFIAIFGITVFAVIGIVLGISLLNRKSGEIQFVALSDQEKRELFQNIVANNAQGVLNSQNKVPSTAAANAASSYLATESDSSIAADPAISRIGLVPFEVSDKILVSEYTNESGPVTCTYSGYSDSRLNDIYSNTTSTSASYQDAEGNYYNKYENTYQGTLIAANYSKGTNSSNESYDYRGGQFAVYSKYEYEPLQLDASAPELREMTVSGEGVDGSAGSPSDMNIDDYIDMYFGTSVNVLGKVSENGKDYYVIESENYNYCTDTWVTQSVTATPNFWEGEGYPESQTTTVDSNNRTVLRQWIDASNYQVHKSEDYLQTVAPENLISRMTYTNFEVEPTAENINEYFTFDLVTDVRDIGIYQSNVDTTPIEYNPEGDANRTFSLFAQNNVALVSSSNPDLKLNYVYYTDDRPSEVSTLIYIPEYYKERDFFPSGEIGDVLFEAENTISDSYKIMAVQSDATPKANFTLSTVNGELNAEDNMYASFSIYETAVDDMAIVNSTIYTPTVSRSISDMTLDFGGESVAAKVYNYETNNTIYYSVDPSISVRDVAIPEPGADVCESEDGCIVSGHIVVFERNNSKYAFTLNKGVTYTVPFDLELFNSYQFSFAEPSSAGFESLKNDYVDYLNTFKDAAVTEPAVLE